MRRAIAIVMGMIIGQMAWGQTKPTSRPMDPQTAAATQASKLSEKLSVTEHEMKVGNQVLKYKATAGYMVVKNEEGKEKANFFFVAYEKNLEGGDKSERPITYVFNGGPGAAAVWLHMGTAGPKRVSLLEDGQVPAPPYRLGEDQYSGLGFSDMGFFDTVR